MNSEQRKMNKEERAMLKIGIHANFQLRSFFYEKTPAKAMETAASMPPKAMRKGKRAMRNEKKEKSNEIF